MRLAALMLCACTSAASASDLDASWDATLYGYADSQKLRADSAVNPGVARLAQRADNIEARIDVKAQNDASRFTARPILALRNSSNAFGAGRHNEAYLSQWQIRLQAADGVNLSAGREVMNWGPAQFRSPSSPFYFDNGRTDPMRELTGMDALKLSLTPDMQNSVHVAYVKGRGYSAQPDSWQHSWLAGFERKSGANSWGLVGVKPQYLPAFFGAHAQRSIGDEATVYAEAGSSALALPPPSPRRTTALAGINYTFENGLSSALEYLHDDRGYDRQQLAAYFLAAAPILAMPPPLLGRDYLHLVVQSNPMEADGYWRLMYTRNLTDLGCEIAGYGETVLAGQLSAYLLASLPVGDAHQEFSSLMQSRLTAGLKFALP